jgi:glycosyltransferase involved in cell wall biosynthesis
MDQNLKSNRLPFSVLLSIYHKENPEFFRRALQSIWTDQTLRPTEIVIVRDGPLTPELDAVIAVFSLTAPVKLVTLSENRGLGIALAKGLEACSEEIIARMDSDDISVPERFEKQICYLTANPGIAFISSDIAEFSTGLNDITAIRAVPGSYQEILQFAKTRNPMNHMAVMFKKSAVLDAGNYQPFPGYEDYFLWARMLMKGYQAANIKDNLVYGRVGNNMLARRKGVAFFKQELRLQKAFYSLEFINSSTYLKNMVLRSIPRLLPTYALAYVYKFLRK